MRPNKKTRLSDFLHYAISAKAMSELRGHADLAEIMAGLEKRTKEALAQKNELLVKITVDRIPTKYFDTIMDPSLIEIGGECRSVDRHHPEFDLTKRLFPEAPSDLATPQGTGLIRQIASGRTMLATVEMLPSHTALDHLRGLCAAYGQLLDRAEPAVNTLQQSVDNYSLFLRQEDLLREELLSIFEQFHGQLLQRHPRQKKIVGSYYWDGAQSSSRKPGTSSGEPASE